MQSDLQASRTDDDATRQQELDSLRALLEEQRQNATVSFIVLFTILLSFIM